MLDPRDLKEWAIWALIFATVLGGKPWHFPKGGELWLDWAAGRRDSVTGKQ
jgi:hypothetical protein